MKRSSFPREEYKTNAIRTERNHYDRNQMERHKQYKKEKREKPKQQSKNIGTYSRFKKIQRRKILKTFRTI